MQRRWLTRQLRQLRLVPALLGPTARAVGWAAPLAAFAPSVGLLVVAVRRGQASSAEGLVVWLRTTVVVGALGHAFLLDDPSEPTIPGVPLPATALTLEVGALLTIRVALAAAGSRLAPERRGGVMAAPTLLVVTGAAILLPARVALYAQPGSPGWAGAHQRWAMLLGFSLAAFAAASRDPAHGRVRSQVRRLSRGRLTNHADPSPVRGAEDQAGLT